MITPPVLDILSTLPLRTVTLVGAKCPDDAWPDNFGSAWPLVAKLSLPDQPLSLDFLHRFSVLPKLEHLELQLKLAWIDGPPPTPRSPTKPVHYAPLHTLASSCHGGEYGGSEDPDDIIR